MSYSNAYIIYPINRALEKAVAGVIGLLPESMAGSVARDGSVTIADIFFTHVATTNKRPSMPTYLSL